MFPVQKTEAPPVVKTLLECAQVAQRIQSETQVNAIQKQDRTPVTLADFSVQAIVSKELHTAFAQDPLVGEEKADFLRSPEGASVLKSILTYVKPWVADAQSVCKWIDRGTAEPSDRYWTLDPIDGTKGFLRGEHYAIALALIENQQVTLGLLACPRWSLHGNESGTLVLAALGEGTWACSFDQPDNWQRLSVDHTSSLEKARMLRSVEKEHTDVSRTGRLMQALGIQTEAVQMDSAAKYALVAAAQGDIFLRIPAADRILYREKIWDMAAGALVVSEAGGTVTDIDGRPLEFFGERSLERNRGMLATNGKLHKPVLEALKKLEV